MKKVLLILSIFLLLVFIPNLKAVKENDYLEKVNKITFNNLSSKRINEVFEDLNVGVIELEISLGFITKNYKVNYYYTDNLEKELTKKIVNELEKEGLREEAVTATIKGFKINKMILRCNEETIKIIKSRSND